MLVPERHYLFELKKKKRLAKILRTDLENFKNIETSYKVFPFDRSVNSKKRRLHNTDYKYKALLRRINNLLHKVNFPDYIYAGVPNRDFLDNAYAHHHRPYIQSVDIKNFFPSTIDSYVYGFFHNKFKTSPDIAKILTLLTTYQSNKNSTVRHIPQGFPTSTLLSFLAYFDLFNGIYKICQRKNIHFTLFVDDMTFSSYYKIPKSFINHINSLVKKYGLSIHPDKIQRFHRYQPKLITGVIVDPFTQSFKTPNKLQKKIYDNVVSLHNFSVTTFDDYIRWKKLVLKLNGQINSIKRIEPERQTPYISKVLKDSKENFLTHSVKGASYQLLSKEFKSYIQI